jgi:hypothetical protein
MPGDVQDAHPSVSTATIADTPAPTRKNNPDNSFNRRISFRTIEVLMKHWQHCCSTHMDFENGLIREAHM